MLSQFQWAIILNVWVVAGAPVCFVLYRHWWRN